MPTFLRRPLLLTASLLLAACATQGPARGLTVAGAASDADRARLIERIASLAGTWEWATPEGTSTAAVFRVSSAGSVVHETMFPGTEHEMTNVYHMDGPSLLVTHYCAEGNQPRMRATAAGEGQRIEFVLDSVTNLRRAGEPYMGALTVTFVDKDHVTFEWGHFQDGKQDGTARFDLVRKR